MTVMILIAVVLLLIVIASKCETPMEDRSFLPDPPPREFPRQTWEKDHFTKKHLHRDDKKHDRHKRNQSPW